MRRRLDKDEIAASLAWRPGKEPLMPLNATRKLIESHLESGEMTPGEEIAIHIDQTLTQDATRRW